MGAGQSSRRCELDNVPAPLLLPSLSPPAASTGQVQEAGGPKDDLGCSMVVREALLPNAVDHAVGLQEDSHQQPDDHGPVCGSSSPGFAAPKTGRLLNF